MRTIYESVAEQRRDEQRLRSGYRSAARRLYRSCGVRVGHHALVQPCEDGAFVETTVWVPMAEARTPTIWWMREITEGGAEREGGALPSVEGNQPDWRDINRTLSDIVAHRSLILRVLAEVVRVTQRVIPSHLYVEGRGEIPALMAAYAEAQRVTNEFSTAPASVEGSETPWQPIETAKEDGEIVLVFDEGAMFRAVIEKGRWIDIECDQPVVPPPSHWMPMPKPPAASSSCGAASPPELQVRSTCAAHGPFDPRCVTCPQCLQASSLKRLDCGAASQEPTLSDPDRES